MFIKKRATEKEEHSEKCNDHADEDVTDPLTEALDQKWSDQNQMLLLINVSALDYHKLFKNSLV